MSGYETLDFVFGDTGGPEVVFVEVEDSSGRSIRCGEWVDRGDGYRVLRVRVDRSSIYPPAKSPRIGKCPNPLCHDGWVSWGGNESGGAPAIPCRTDGCPHAPNRGGQSA